MKNIANNEANPHSPINNDSGHKEREIINIMEKVKVAGYDRTANGNELKSYCKSKGYEIFEIYSDYGYSKKSTNRPEFNKMIADMENKRFSKIVVFDISRISRNMKDVINFFDKAEKYGCSVELISEKIDTSTAMGMMFARMLTVFSQYESKMRSEGIKQGLANKKNKVNGHE